jgi:hypothetical protein
METSKFSFPGQGSLLFLLLACVWIVVPSVGAEPIQQWPAELTCEWGGIQLQCHFRPLVPVSISDIELLVDDGKPQAIGDWQPFVSKAAVSAVLWVVDVSNPARSTTVMRQAALLRNWLEGMAAHHRIGLAAFAEDAELLAPIGSDKATLARAVDDLRARGHSTAFYRSLIDAVGILKKIEAERKSLWVLSDGLAEDTVYSHQDVVAAARAANVAIVGLGYAERESQQIDLQRLQRLSEETGGYFVAASVQGTLPPGTLTGILAVIDGGGSFTVDLPELYGPHRLTLRLLAAAGGSFEKTLNVEGPEPLSQVKPKTSPAVARGGSYLTWIAIGIGLLTLVLALLWRQLHRPGPLPLLARMQRMDSVAAGELAIRTRVARIGRAADNDIRLDNDSVSAHHAELRQGRDGTFAIIDLGSTNGVWVNGEPVSCRNLHDGDTLELGEVRLWFRQGS